MKESNPKKAIIIYIVVTVIFVLTAGITYAYLDWFNTEKSTTQK